MATTSAKPPVSSLKTPLSATYPSELKSPVVGPSAHIKLEDGQQTPITPPAAYLDFLKALSPALMTPLPTGTSPKFNFNFNEMSGSATSSSTPSSTPTSIPADKPSPTASVHSTRSSRSNSCCNCESKKPSDMKINIPPPSPFVRPLSARTPRLHIPQSPYTAGVVGRSPMSATSTRSPYSAISPKSEFDADGKKISSTKTVSVRQVVTRTVTYTRTPIDHPPPAPLEPAPKGKRRKVE